MSMGLATLRSGMPPRPVQGMTAPKGMRRFRWRGSLFTLLLVALLPLHAWSSIYECRDQEGHRIITDSPSQLEECKTISATPPGSKKSSFGGNQSYGDSSSAVTQSAPEAAAPQYPPILVTGPNGEVLSEPPPAQGSGSPPQKPDAAQAPVVNQLHPFSPPVAAPQAPPEQKP